MDFACENEVNVQNENALLFAVVTKPAPVIEYLKTIASIIGASHILGVFENDDYIKVYFDDKKYLDTLIRSGIHIMGHHIKVDYVVPPGIKVILSNIDPVVSNNDLIRLMSMFGSVVSPVFRLPISDDIELCHIDHGQRYVYMNLNIPVPNALEFKYGDQICKIDIKLDSSLSVIPNVKKEPIESNTTESSPNSSQSQDSSIDDFNITDPIDANVQGASIENTEQQNQNLSSTQKNNLKSNFHLGKVGHSKLITNSHTNKKSKYKRKNFKTSKKRARV